MADGTAAPFGDRFKALQARAGLTNEQMARRLDTGLRNVQRWRGAVHAPRLEHLVAIADALDVSLDELVGRAARPTTGATAAAPGAVGPLADDLPNPPRRSTDTPVGEASRRSGGRRSTARRPN